MATTNQPMDVDLGLKLTSINIDKLLTLNWKRSFQNEIAEVNFIFRKLEWIGFEQLTIITGWMEELLVRNKVVNIYLQQGTDVNTASETYKKRKRCLSLVLKEWKIGNLLSKQVKMLSGGIQLSDTV